MNELDYFKNNDTMEIIEFIDMFFKNQVSYCLTNETFVNAMFDGNYYDPDIVELVKCEIENEDGDDEIWYSVGETDEGSEHIEWLYADKSLEKATTYYMELKEKDEYKDKVISSLEDWEAIINEQLSNGYIEISSNPGNAHGYFARVSLYNEDRLLIAESLYTLDIDELQLKLDESNNIKYLISKALNIDEDDVISIDIRKKKDSPGFDRYYQVNIEFSDFQCEFNSYISGLLQHQEKNVFSIIEDDLIEAYKEALLENE